MLWPSDFIREIEKMRRDMDTAFSRIPLYNRMVPQYPFVNLYDQKEDLVLVAEIPGIKKEEINILYNNGLLTLSGKRELKKFGKSEELRLEQPEGNFEKIVRIPQKIKDSEIKATFEDGILKITLPKAEEAKPRQIAIQS